MTVALDIWRSLSTPQKFLLCQLAENRLVGSADFRDLRAVDLVHGGLISDLGREVYRAGQR